MLELPILGFLEEEPLHGYELKKRLDDTLGAVSGVSYGSLYPALRRLEKAGAIEAVEPPVPGEAIPATGSIGGETAAARMRRRLTSSRRKRKEYRITPGGRQLLLDLLRAEEDAGDDRAFTLKLAFCRYLEPGDRLALFERRRAWLSEKLARVRSTLTRSAERTSPDLYTRSLIEQSGEATRREMEWVEQLIAGERDHSTEPGTEEPRRDAEAVSTAPEGGTT